jgi:hypothetical protein
MVDMSFLLSVSIPSDTGFLDPLRELTVKVAEYAGYGVEEATELGTAIIAEASRAIAMASAHATPIDVLFETDEGRFHVTLAHETTAAASGGSTPAFVCRPEGGRRVDRNDRNHGRVDGRRDQRLRARSRWRRGCLVCNGLRRSRLLRSRRLVGRPVVDVAVEIGRRSLAGRPRARRRRGRAAAGRGCEHHEQEQAG